jgi:hypothetical protein
MLDLSTSPTVVCPIDPRLSRLVCRRTGGAPACSVAITPGSARQNRRRRPNGQSVESERASMHCYSCALEDLNVPAVGICQRCGAASCMRHIRELSVPQIPPGMGGMSPIRIQLVCMRCLDGSSGRKMQRPVSGAQSKSTRADEGAMSTAALLRLHHPTGDQRPTEEDDLPDARVVILQFEELLRGKRRSTRLLPLRHLLQRTGERMQSAWRHWSAAPRLRRGADAHTSAGRSVK